MAGALLRHNYAQRHSTGPSGAGEDARPPPPVGTRQEHFPGGGSRGKRSIRTSAFGAAWWIFPTKAQSRRHARAKENGDKWGRRRQLGRTAPESGEPGGRNRREGPRGAEALGGKASERRAPQAPRTATGAARRASFSLDGSSFRPDLYLQGSKSHQLPVGAKRKGASASAPHPPPDGAGSFRGIHTAAPSGSAPPGVGAGRTQGPPVAVTPRRFVLPTAPRRNGATPHHCQCPPAFLLGRRAPRTARPPFTSARPRAPASAHSVRRKARGVSSAPVEGAGLSQPRPEKAGKALIG